MRSWFIIMVLLVPSLACSDAAHRAASDSDDTSDLRTIVGGLLRQYTREVEATCPCRARDGEFASADECTEKLGHQPSFADCVSTEISEWDSEELRDTLSCMRDRYQERARCLEDEGCAQEEAERCYTASRECPVLDPEVLTRALRECPGGTLLGR